MPDTPGKSLKVLCSTCGFLVRPEGHDLRCSINGHSSMSAEQVKTAEQISLLRRRAWVGDAQHTTDIRLVLLSADVPDKELAVIESSLRDKVNQAEFWKSYPGPKVEPQGSSDHSVSQAFEASYEGAFRRVYLTGLCDRYLRAVLAGKVRARLLSVNAFELGALVSVGIRSEL